jgi:hypothetical protein
MAPSLVVADVVPVDSEVILPEKINVKPFPLPLFISHGLLLVAMMSFVEAHHVHNALFWTATSK